MPEIAFLFKNIDTFNYYGMIPINKLFILNDKLSEPHRFYHNHEHINNILSLIDDGIKNKREGWDRLSNEDIYALKISTYFHDAIYDPKKKDNEEQSAELFKSMCSERFKNRHPDELNKVADIILDTKTHKPSSYVSSIFCDLDLYNIKYGDLETLLRDEYKIFKEYQFYDNSLYRDGRIAVIEHLKNQVSMNEENLNALVSYVKFRRPKVGIYAGSFNPFTKGHLNVLRKAEKIFDKVIIAKGYNPEKINNSTLLCNSIEAHKSSLQKVLPYHQVEIFEGFISDFLKKMSNTVDVHLVRGLRNGNDLDYEVTQLQYIKDMFPEISVVFIQCDKELEHVSSSAMRALEKIEKGSSEKYIS